MKKVIILLVDVQNAVRLGVIKSIMGELTDPSNRAEGFALMPVVWGFGATVGSVPQKSHLSLTYMLIQTIPRGLSFSPSRTLSKGLWSGFLD